MPDTQKNFHKKLLGRSGENRAVRFLRLRGYRILCRNFKSRIGEVDIIAKKGPTFVFIEVKTRENDFFGNPCEAVTFRKQEKYRLLAQQYLQRAECLDMPTRFDVIEILGRKINHIKNAF